MPEQMYDPQHPERGWQPAVPLPYWRRPWWRLFRLTPACYPCGRLAFRTRGAYETHWREIHMEAPR
jgi:hypothetical protein